MFIAGPLPRSLRQRMQQTALVWTVGTVVLIATVTSNAFGQTQIRTLTAPQVDQVVDHLQAAVQN